mmetsp:Transcript_11299/g.22868  ORF Transcript_11299/g.22868 Transcript_11299/m.22868 type:complete len:84 (+) Transcript_11299:278-529(+)
MSFHSVSSLLSILDRGSRNQTMERTALYRTSPYRTSPTAMATTDMPVRCPPAEEIIYQLSIKLNQSTNKLLFEREKKGKMGKF